MGIVLTLHVSSTLFVSFVLIFVSTQSTSFECAGKAYITPVECANNPPVYQKRIMFNEPYL